MNEKRTDTPVGEIILDDVADTLRWMVNNNQLAIHLAQPMPEGGDSWAGNAVAADCWEVALSSDGENPGQISVFVDEDHLRSLLCGAPGEHPAVTALRNLIPFAARPTYAADAFDPEYLAAMAEAEELI